MTKIPVTQRFLRGTISLFGFPLTLIQLIVSKCSLHKHKPPGELIPIGTRSLHTIVTGTEKNKLPTIILESGMGGSALDWALVQPELSKYTRVLSYDRAGFGWSTETIQKPTCKAYVQDLRDILTRVKLDPPYILVGHSYGGMIMRLFASEYPEEVVGIVLVDSTHEKRYVGASLNQRRNEELQRQQNRLRLGYLLSPIGLPRLLKLHIGAKRLPPIIQKKVKALGLRNNAYKAAYLEFICIFESANQLINSFPLKSELPLIVVTAGKQSDDWKEMQKEFLNLTWKAQQILVEDSIQVHKPRAVIDSVLSLLLGTLVRNNLEKPLSYRETIRETGGQGLNPSFETKRLLLRLFELSDAKFVQVLAGDQDVASTTLSIPHPYPDGVAEGWIERTRQAAEKGDIFSFALLSKENGKLIGCISLRLAKQFNHAELAYWVGKTFWGQGFATEAARRVIQFGFEELELNRIYAAAMTRNPASYKVMSKIGMKHEGTFPQHIIKAGKYEDLIYFGMLKTDYLKMV